MSKRLAVWLLGEVEVVCVGDPIPLQQSHAIIGSEELQTVFSAIGCDRVTPQKMDEFTERLSHTLKIKRHPENKKIGECVANSQ